MVSPTTDRRYGVVGSRAIKNPVAVATTGNISLSGEQTIDGYAVKAINAASVPDRVLAWSQTDAKTNGVYDVSTGTWTRSLDFDGVYDIVNGTIVPVTHGTYASRFLQVTTADPITIGTTTLSFSPSLVVSTYARTAAEIAAGVTPTNYAYAPGNVLRYGADNSGVASCVTAFANAVAQCVQANGSPVFVPDGTYVINAAQAFNTTGSGVFQAGIQIIGESLNAIIDNRVANATMWTFNTDTPLSKWSLGLAIKNLQIKSTTNPAGSGGLKFIAQYSMTLEDLYIHGLTGSALSWPVVVGDTDACTMVAIKRVRVDTCATGGNAWGVNFIPNTGMNQTSFVDIEHLFVQNCGAADTAANISAMTNANPCVVTANGHGYSNGQQVRLVGIVGMVNTNGASLNGLSFTVAGATANTFQLSGIATNAYTAYTSGGQVLPGEPTSGGLGWRGQILRMRNSAFTINQNVAFWARGGAGLGDNADLEGVDFENNLSTHLLAQGVDVFRASGIQIFNNTANPAVCGAVFDGAVLINGAASLVKNVLVDGAYIRAAATSGTSNPNANLRQYTAFQLGGANAQTDSCRVRGVSWNDFDYAGQSRLSGWYFDEVVQQCQLTATSTVLLTFAPTRFGNKTPLRLAGSGGGTASTSGEWIQATVSASGVTISNAGLANSTLYYVYLYDNNGVQALALSTTAPAIDPLIGLNVKSGDPTRLHVGYAKTDGSANFLLPSVTWDPASINNGASLTTTVTVAGAVAGDYVQATFSLPLQGMSLTAEVSAADTASVTLMNNTGGALNLASGTLKARIANNLMV